MEYSGMVKLRNCYFIAWPYVKHVCALVGVQKQGFLLFGQRESVHVVIVALSTLCDPDL